MHLEHHVAAAIVQGLALERRQRAVRVDRVHQVHYLARQQRVHTPRDPVHFAGQRVEPLFLFQLEDAGLRGGETVELASGQGLGTRGGGGGWNSFGYLRRDVSHHGAMPRGGSLRLLPGVFEVRDHGSDRGARGVPVRLVAAALAFREFGKALLHVGEPRRRHSVHGRQLLLRRLLALPVFAQRLLESRQAGGVDRCRHVGCISLRLV